MIRDLGWSAVGASIAIGIALWFVGDGRSPFLLASLGGSTVFLFALTESEAAQPRALFGGHLGGALIGILAFRFFGDALWVSVLAVVLTMVFMVLTRTIHPPAGANPLFMVHNHAGMGILLKPVSPRCRTVLLVISGVTGFVPGRIFSSWEYSGGRVSIHHSRYRSRIRPAKLSGQSGVTPAGSRSNRRTPISPEGEEWRRGWDSNPRGGSHRQVDFESTPLRPLRYPSARGRRYS